MGFPRLIWGAIASTGSFPCMGSDRTVYFPLRIWGSDRTVYFPLRIWGAIAWVYSNNERGDRNVMLHFLAGQGSLKQFPSGQQWSFWCRITLLNGLLP